MAVAPPSLACGDDSEHVGNAPSYGNECPAVRDIQTMPFRDDWGVDAAYDRFRTGADCDQVLIKALASVEPMPDPRCPSYGGFVEADAAVFVLLEKYHVDFREVLPKSELAHWKEQGVYAYFAYVEEPKRRAALSARLLERIGKAGKGNDGTQRK
jgi:hypothetical protein